MHSTFFCVLFNSNHDVKFVPHFPATESEISTILFDCSNKQSHFDPIPALLLIKCASVLVPTITNKKLIRRWDSERELSYDDIVHVLQNTIDSCINSATDRRGYVLERMFTKFSEIAQYNGHYAVQGHSMSPILVPIESSYTTSY